MSVEAAFRAAGVSASRARAEAPRAAAAMLEFGITTQPRASMFIAQVLHESVLLGFFEEIASGAAYEGRADLGNTQPGDGRRYKGRGPIQLTGRSNYRAAGKALGIDLEAHPERAAEHAIGWRIAGWYWQTRGLSAYADRGDFRGVTIRINGAATEGAPSHYARRKQLLARVKAVDCRPVPDGPAAWLREDELRWVREYDAFDRRREPSAQEKRRIAVLLRVMTTRRKSIWREAQKTGWNVNDRTQRYKSLLSRTR